jgi:hypothetical protein
MNRREWIGLMSGTPAAAAAGGVCGIAIRTSQVLQEDFGGAGFHNFHHLHPAPADVRDRVILKRWRELGASFARVTDRWDLKPEERQALVEHALELKRTGTTIYLTTWNPRDTASEEERQAYARTVVDNIEDLVRGKGATNVRYYCMTNELSLKRWADMRTDLPKFRDYHQKIYEELRARRIDVGLLATDASPINYWDTIEWAAENMDDITAVYGGHHYINDYGLEDPAFYPWFLSKLRWGAGIAAAKGKKFIIGEFGAKQYKGARVDGKNWDACHYWDTPLEPWVGIQVAEAAIAAINAGIHAFGYWTFADFPDTASANYANKWGLFKWTARDHSNRPIYYAYGLLARFFRGPARAVAVESGDELVRAAAVMHRGSGFSVSLAAVNRREREVGVRIRLDASVPRLKLRKYVYDPLRPPLNACGDLQEPAGVLDLRGGSLADVLGPETLTVYTTAFEDTPPAAVSGLRSEAANGLPNLRWEANRDPDLCYYRIYRSPKAGFVPGPGNQIGSTVATEYVDDLAGRGLTYFYKVRAVDGSGNAGRPSEEVEANV